MFCGVGLMLFIILNIMFVCSIAAAAIWDFCQMRIPNKLVLGALGIACISLAFGGGETHNLNEHFIPAFIVFVCCVFMFFLKMMGGGDAKLIPVACLWLGVGKFAVFFLVMAFVGGLLAALGIALRKSDRLKEWIGKCRHVSHPLLKDGWVQRTIRGERVIPYGVAIAVGVFCAALF